ncbi:MAG TPA: EAL domain-containing protein [Burkholderiaceae bacterium]|nr:EAL domain-containing protein [Burkholderiaceae bacterium]HQR70895.1 EAL domain-containing protein [Burkholderiaceae bacterium]
MTQTAEDLVTSLSSCDLQRQLQEYRALLANDSVGIVTVCDGEVMQCNPSAARLFGWEPERLLGQSAAVFFSSEDEFQAFANRIGDALNAGGSPAVEWRTRRSDGSTFWARLLVKSITPGGPGGETVWMIEDITSRKAMEVALSRVREELEQRVRAAHDELAWSNERLVAEMYERSEVEERARRMALYDDITALPNRRLLESRLDEAVRNHQLGGDRLAVLIIDIDDFTKLNDALGHRVGDTLLQQVATRLIDTVRTSDLVARVGSDEFAVVLGRLRQPDDAERVATKLGELLAAPYEVDAEQVTATVSIGVACFPADGAGPEMLLRNADAALSFARSRGRANVQLFEPRMNAELLQRLQLEAALRRALDRREFEVHFQPRVLLSSGRVIGAEALLRWRHPEKGLLEPSAFIAVAEDAGLMQPIGEVVLRAACEAASAWSAAGLGELIVSVNLSPREFRGRSLLPMVSQALIDTGLDAERLEVEVTEAGLMRDLDKSEQVLAGLQTMGVRIALDNFGTGYSSLSNLRRFPLNTLKIDGQFVRAAPSDEGDARIVVALAGLASGLGLHVVAEGVETEHQYEFVKHCGCDEAQGYHLSRPLPLDQFEQFVRKRSLQAG